MSGKTFHYYKNKIRSGEPAFSVIAEARLDYKAMPDYNFEGIDPTDLYIPFNLEREYLIELVENKKYLEAKKHIEDMRKTYRNVTEQNFIETFEYHLHATEYAEKNIRSAIEDAKKEFNQHTITIVAVIVGVITLLGTANQAFHVTNLNEGFKTFWSITIAILLVIIITFSLNKNNKCDK